MLEYHEKEKRQLIGEEPAEYVLSDGEPDRRGDIIEPNGWQIDKFAPAALFNHDFSQVIGKWEGVRVADNQLRAKLKFADPGTSPVVDMTRALAKQGLLDSVSVGFRPIEREPRDSKDPYGPQRFKKVELLEASLVAIPANPRARRIMKQFMQQPVTARSMPIETKAAKPMEGLSPVPLGRKIEITANALAALKDSLSDLSGQITSVDSPSDDQTMQVETLSAEIADKERTLATLKTLEANLKTKVQNIASPALGGVVHPPARALFERKSMQPADYFWKALTAGTMMSLWKSANRQVTIDDFVKEKMYGDEAIAIVTKAAVNPAQTTVAGWAQELVQTITPDFLNTLPVASVYGPLSRVSKRLQFGRAGIIKIPTRALTPTINGSFVGEGQPIPVRRLGLSSITLTPKKMAVISTFTREMDMHSVPAIEAVIRQAISEDTANAVDAALVSSTAADTIRPAGLLAAANVPGSITPSTATTSYDKMVADLRALIAYITGNGGGQNLVLLVNPAQALALEWAVLPNGEFAFEGAGNGQVRGMRIIVSANVPAAKPIMLDTNEFVTVTGDVPAFDVSDQAVVHEEDTTPLPIATGAQGSGVLATPTRSLWQTASIGIRMMMDMNWAMQRTGMVASFSGAGVTW